MEEDTESQRPKRRRVDKSGRLAALEKIRNLKGKKNKYAVDEVENVYDVVDEKEYASKVHERGASDWIDEDEVGGYVEDGREIFDEWEEDEQQPKAKKRQREVAKTEKEVSQASKLTKYFKKDLVDIKKKEANVESDSLLANILGELEDPNGENTKIKKTEKKEIKKSELEKNSDVKKPEVVHKPEPELEPKNAKVEEKVPDALFEEWNEPTNDIKVAENVSKTAEKAPVPAKSEPPKTKVEKISYPDALFEEWNTTTKKMVHEEVSDEVQDVAITVNKDENLTMWLWDVWEDTYRKPGHVFLFGKTEINGSFTSTCVQITNVEHCLYLLARKTHAQTSEKVTLQDVYEEFSSIATSLGIEEYRCKTVVKNFAFQVPEVDVPTTCEYLMVRYSGEKKVPEPKGDYNTIAYIFGCNTSATETFLIERSVKGPCWISISNSVVPSNPSTYCKLQVNCSSTSDITVLKHLTNSPPPLVMMSLNLRIVLHGSKCEIVAISCLVNKGYHIDKDTPEQLFNEHYCLLSHPTGKPYPFGFNNAIKDNSITKIQVCDSERGLLTCFLAKIQSLDPDLIITQDAFARQLDVLCQNMNALKIPRASRIGRLKMSNMSGLRKIEEFFVGRMICDVRSSAEELMRLRSYDMATMCKEILKIPDEKIREIYSDDITEMYEKTETLMELIHLTMQDNLYSLRIMYDLQILPLALSITNIAGNLLSNTLRGGRSERNEWLLLHAFAEKDYLVPDKARKLVKNKGNEPGNAEQSMVTKKKAQYAGGLVLDPIKGFYENFVLLMDFNSLYPSIIQEYNLCFTTVKLDEDNTAILPSASAPTGILPSKIRTLVESRRQVKQLLQKSDLKKNEKLKLNIRQKALKLTANSMYGCLGFGHSRFFAQHIASLITQKGRDILTHTKTIVEKLQYKVIYGDTDSIMVLTNAVNFDEVHEKGVAIKQTVNKAYRHVELDIDGVYKYLLLLKKKKYAAVAISKDSSGKLVETTELKGLDIVRRDWCKFAQNAGERILTEILSDKQMDDRVSFIHEYLVTVKDSIRENKVELTQLEITKQLSHNVEDYKETAQSLPHVQVASRMNRTMNRNFKKGDVVGYVICEDGTDNPYIKRAYHLDEMKLNKNLKIDINYYLANQVHPIVTRIIEPLQETNSARIAEHLGLDTQKYIERMRILGQGVQEDVSLFHQSKAERFRFCHKFIFSCQVCKKLNPIRKAFRVENNRKVSVFEKCFNPECNAKATQFSNAVINELIMTVRAAIKRFYEGWLLCDEPLCSSSTRLSTHCEEDGKPVCPICKNGNLVRIYSEKELFNQLDFYKYALSLDDKEINDNHVSIEAQKLHQDLQRILDNFMQLSTFVHVGLDELFRKHPMTTKHIDSGNKEIDWRPFIRIKTDKIVKNGVKVEK